MAGAATLAWSAGVEVRSYRLRHARVPVLPAGAAALHVLHVSDLHLTPRQHGKQAWVARLDELEPDLVVSTGDHLAHPDALPALLAALAPLLRRPGVFVRGSNDYVAPVLKNPARYLLPDDGRRHLTGTPLPWREMSAAMVDAGWVDADNARARLSVAGRDVDLVGTDDPHIGRDDYPAVAGAPDPSADLAIAVTHAPYLAVLDAFAADGWPLVLAGHTHGGQVCLPGGRALVTNCDLEPDRAKGLSRHRDAWLHVSAGLGTSPFAPVRLFCPPEATLLTLVARDGAPPGSGPAR